MLNYKVIRMMVSLLVGGILLVNATCGSIVVNSIRDGIFAYISGSVTSSAFSAQLNDFVLDVFTGNMTLNSQ